MGIGREVAISYTISRDVAEADSGIPAERCSQQALQRRDLTVNGGCLGGSFVISGDRLLREAIAFGSFSLLLRALFRLVSGPLLSRPLSVRSRYIRTTRHHNLLANSHSCRCERNSHRYRRQGASIPGDVIPQDDGQLASLTRTCLTVSRLHSVAG